MMSLYITCLSSFVNNLSEGTSLSNADGRMASFIFSAPSKKRNMCLTLTKVFCQDECHCHSLNRQGLQKPSIVPNQEQCTDTATQLQIAPPENPPWLCSFLKLDKGRTVFQLMRVQFHP